MSKTKQNQQAEEVDLGQLFRMIGNGFNRLFNFIGTIFNEIFKGFLWFVRSSMVSFKAAGLNPSYEHHPMANLS